MKIMMLAGEPSGDLHGSHLAAELIKQSPSAEIFGTGGEKMRQCGVTLLYDLKALAITGLLDVIKNAVRLKVIQTTLLSKIKSERPDLIILIDYPDFNLRFAKKAHRFGVPIVYYISPQVWAWRKGRIRQIKKYIKKIYVIFRFEEELYRKEGVPVEFIGHPLLDIVKPRLTRDEFLKGMRLKADGAVVALLPGSRKRLVKTLLPVMLESARLVHKRVPQVRFIVSKSASLDKKTYDALLARSDLPVTLVEGNTYDVINASDVVLTVSGTATLETAILKKPMAILYKLPLVEYLLAKPLLRIKNIGLVNIVAGEIVVPEFIQSNARPEKIAMTIIDMLDNKSRYEAIQHNLTAVKNALYPDGAAFRAASSILEFLETSTH